MRAFSFVIVCWALAVPVAVLAQASKAPTRNDEALRKHYDLQVVIAERSVPKIINGIVTRVLPMVGAAFLVMFVYAGFLWLTAGGDGKKVDAAKVTLKNAIIGMALVTFAYFIVSFFLGVTAF
jgi:sterol desaturase/sphingolipid hydroxylase (fatty acid hydroxylase superfamily)